MKIVEVISSLDSRGGAEVFVTSLCKELKKDNEVFLIVLYDQIHDSFSNFIKENDIKVFTLGKKKKIDFKAVKTFRKIINKISPDLINFHLSFLLFYFLAFHTKRRRWKLIETFHSVPGVDLTFVDNFFRKVYLKKKRLSFIGISDSITSKAIEKFGKIQICTIYNAISLKTTNEYPTEKTIDFICVANMLEVKNHHYLISEFSLLVKKHKHVKLALVGGGPLIKDVAKQISDLGLQHNIILTNFVSNVEDYLASSKYFVLASTREGNPVSILEAMSFGLPIIAPKVGGISDVVKDKFNGLLFENFNEGTLESKMEKLLEDELLYKQISLNNTIDSKKYDIKVASAEYISYFSKVISR